MHRDLKPANLFLTRRPSGAPFVKVLDFGISRRITPDAAELTNSRALLGSPFYMAPEQMARARRVDPRSDVWSMGVVLHDANPRLGAWFTYHDGSEGGAQEPDDAAGLVTATMPARGDSTLAVHTSGNDRFAEWGAGIGFHLSNADYDATGYRGIAFWARAEEGLSTDLLVAFVDRQTHPGGGICGPEEGQVPCYDHFHTRVTLASDWKHVKVPVECLVQTGYGVFDALAQSGLRDIQFSFSAGQAFDLWIDDVAFYR
ncbi:protein kinase [Sorangium sp. So ce118]